MLLVAGGQFVFFQRVRMQVDDLQARKVGDKVVERHPKLAVVVERQTDFLFVVLRDELPFGAPKFSDDIRSILERIR